MIVRFRWYFFGKDIWGGVFVPDERWGIAVEIIQ
jgi:hypothetical protein